MPRPVSSLTADSTGLGALRRHTWILAACLAGLAVGCASAANLRTGQRAEQQEDYDLAVVAYAKAVRDRPDDRNARLALDRARLRAAEQHYFRGRRLDSDGHYEEALVEFQIAAELNPTSGDISEALRVGRQKSRMNIAVRDSGETELEAMITRMRNAPQPGLDLPEGVPLPDSLIFREAGSRDVLSAIGKLADVNVVFDPAFRNTTISIDLRGTSLSDALNAVTGSTRNFYRVTAQRTITIIPDTPAKRREYEEEIVRTFYLSNADLNETIDMLRVVVDLRRVAPISATNAISIKDTPERIAAAGRLISTIDKARAEVVIDVELLEVDRQRLKEYGVQIASPGSPGIDGVASINQDDLTLSTLRNLTQADVFLSGMPSLFYRLLKRDANTRTLASPRLRTSEGLPAEARFGERVPVPVTTFSPIATGGVSQQPITSFEYQNIGVNIDITPRIHHNEDVSLTIRAEISNISGTGFGGLPTFGNREIATTLRLRDGETTMLAGLIRDDERVVVEGIPGLSDLPLVGRLFARRRLETQETDILLTITPHIIRVLELREGDLRSFRIGGQAPLEAPVRIPPPPQDPASPEEASPESEEELAAPTGTPGPIRPVEPTPGPPTGPPGN